MVSTTINLDNELAMQFESLCKELGMTINSAITAFVRNSVKSGSIKTDEEDEKAKARREFGEILAKIRREAASLPEMTLEEINAEIAACREERR